MSCWPGASSADGGLSMRVLRDRLGLAALAGVRVAPAGELPDQRLRHVLDRREPAGGVAVERRVADGDLALVAGRQQQVPVLVGQPHEQRAAHAGLQVLRRDAGELDRAVVRVDHRRDRDDGVVQPGRLARSSASAERVLAGVLRRQPDAVHAVGAERVDGEGGDHRGVDAAGQAEHDRGHAVLVDEVAQPQHQRPPDLLAVAQRLGDRAGPRLERGHRLLREHVPGDRHRPDPALAALRHRGRVDASGRRSAGARRTAARGRAARRRRRRPASRRRRPARPARRPGCSRRSARAPRPRGGGPAAAAGRPWPARTARRWGRRRGRPRPARRPRTGRPRPRGPRRWSARRRSRAAARPAARCRARSSGPRRRRRSWAGAACSSGRRPRRRTAARRRCAGRRGGGWRRRGGRRRRRACGRPAPGPRPRCAPGTRRRRRRRRAPASARRAARSTSACSLARAKDSRSTRSSAG